MSYQCLHMKFGMRGEREGARESERASVRESRLRALLLPPPAQSSSRSETPTLGIKREAYRSVQFSVCEELLHRNVQRFRGGLVFKAHGLCVSLNTGLESNEEEEEEEEEEEGGLIWTRLGTNVQGYLAHKKHPQGSP